MKDVSDFKPIRKRFDKMNVLDLEILSYLSHNGRESFAKIGKKINLSAVTVKNRVDKLTRDKILKVQGTLQIDQFYTLSAQIYIGAKREIVEKLVESLAKRQEVYHLVKTAGRSNLMIGFLASSLEDIEQFITNEIRTLPELRQLDVHIGEIPIVPKGFLPQFN
ncbi:MAG: Lrp/AsnC family transcriptional regulator [Patescibacteria group bacterium]